MPLPFRPRRDSFPADLWTQCPSCGEMLYNKQLEKNLRVCSRCNHHFRLRADSRLQLLVDPGTWEERDADLVSVDVLGFVDTKPYPDRLDAARLSTGARDAAVRGVGRIGGEAVSVCIMDFAFMGGSMGAVVGEKVTRSAEDALEERLPLLVVSASGGARMQEGTLALMQLVRTCAALAQLADSGVPYISLMTDPTTGGVFASFAALGDVNLAEPGALIGFAGTRVAAGTTGETLPEGFQRAEFLFQHGFVDRVVPRAELRNELSLLLRYLRPVERRRLPVAEAAAAGDPALAVAAGYTNGKVAGASDGWVPQARESDVTIGASAGTGAMTEIIAPPVPPPPSSSPVRVSPELKASVWARVQLARNVRRPHTLELVSLMASDVIELHGDRAYGDDEAIAAGFATIGERRVLFVGHQKGAEVEENIRRSFGMPHPEGYRKAMRLMLLAERLGLPIVTFIDTPGASPDAGSEERGQAEAIARSIMTMTTLRVPIVTVITGEGGSGGALAIAVGDVVLALENAIYSVISPEGCASILWRTPEAAQDAAVAMRLTASDQHELGVVDEVIPEPGDGAHTDAEGTARSLGDAIGRQLDRLVDRDVEVLLAERLERYRRMGQVASIGPVRRPRRRRRRGMTDRLRELLGPPRREVVAPPNETALRANPAEETGPVQERLPLHEEV